MEKINEKQENRQNAESIVAFLSRFLNEQDEVLLELLDQAGYYRIELEGLFEEAEKSLQDEYCEENLMEFFFHGLSLHIDNNQPPIRHQVRDLILALYLRQFSGDDIEFLERRLEHKTEDSYTAWRLLEILSGAYATNKPRIIRKECLPCSIPFPSPFYDMVKPVLDKVLNGLGSEQKFYWPGGVNSTLRCLHAGGALSESIWETLASHYEGESFANAIYLVCFDDAKTREPEENEENLLCLREKEWQELKCTFVLKLLGDHFDSAKLDSLAVLSEECDGSSLRGGQWLLFAAHLIETFEVEKLAFNYDKTPSSLLPRVIASLGGPHPDEDLEHFAGELQKKCEPSTLKLLRGHCDFDPLVFEKALGIEGSDEANLNRALVGSSLQSRDYSESSYDSFYTNNDNPENGVLDATMIKEAAGSMSIAEIKKVINGFTMPGEYSVANAKMLFNALFGINEAKIAASLKKFGQPAAKALGLLPLPVDKTEKEIERRYLELLEFEKGCQKFGAERRANSKAASLVGMENLAINAGFSDSLRLQWWVEARLGGEESMPVTSFEEGDYQVELQTSVSGSRIQICKKGKPIKSVPAVLKKVPNYKQLKEFCDAAKKQYSRMRKRVEQMMIESEGLTKRDIGLLKAIPAGKVIIENLVLKTFDGRYGLYESEKDELVTIGINADKLSLSDNNLFPVQVAHAMQFLEDGVLSAWQSEVVRRGITQPFKQLFRELYVLTDAERETATYSNRFSGRIVNTSVASGLLSGRGWKTSSRGEVKIHRVLRSLGLATELTWERYGHYFTEEAEATTSSLHFTPYPEKTYVEDERVPLDKVDPQLYSEVLRDVDLVVSVAYVGEAGQISPNSMVVRKELLRAIIKEMEVTGVKIDGKYATIDGVRASYRVHMETGAIYIGSGEHICVIPDNSKALNGDIYLPFVADEDLKLREIISRILMLLNDDKIKDKVILQQIDDALS